MKRVALLFTTAALFTMFQNCAPNVAFREAELASLVDDSGTGTPGDSGDGSPTTGQEGVEHFKVTLNSESAPLDMLWVIDNSGSMDTEAALVRKNFDAFLQALNRSTNFRLLLISRNSTTGTGVSIPSSFDSNTHKQISYAVGSWNGTQILVDKLKSLPEGFLRQNSKKIVVFVTDDNSSMSSSTFLNTLQTQQAWPAKDVSVFSFIGLDAQSSPCMARVGAVYKELAAATGGSTYNICNEDWSSHFSDLMNASVSKAVRRFSLGVNAVKSIVEVKVDGVVLNKDAYSLSGKVLTLADSVNLAENSTVSVVYKY